MLYHNCTLCFQWKPVFLTKINFEWLRLYYLYLFCSCFHYTFFHRDFQVFLHFHISYFPLKWTTNFLSIIVFILRLDIFWIYIFYFRSLISQNFDDFPSIKKKINCFFTFSNEIFCFVIFLVFASSSFEFSTFSLLKVHIYIF